MLGERRHLSSVHAGDAQVARLGGVRRRGRRMRQQRDERPELAAAEQATPTVETSQLEAAPKR